MALTWTSLLADQLHWHWRHHLRPHLDGLTDEEYLWEPVPGCWSVRPRGRSQAPIQAGRGDTVIEFEIPEPVPPPVTTIAWRLGHVIVGIFGERNHAHFGGPAASYPEWDYSATATGALEQLDAGYSHWHAAVSALTPEELATPVGAAEGPFAQAPMAELVLHINREVLHHGAEILVLRDLYRARSGGI